MSAFTARESDRSLRRSVTARTITARAGNAGTLLWNRSLFQFLRRRVRSSVEVQDLAQETYLRLLRARDLSDVRNPLAYLLQVANHVALEWCDRQSRSDSMVVLDEDMLVDRELPALELDARLSQQRLEETLASASPMMRAVVLLRMRDERSYQEIAADGCSA